MVYTILISVVFVAELIITITVFQNLSRLDKVILGLNDTVVETRLGIRDISVLLRKISEQWLILAQDFVNKTKQNTEEALLSRFSKLLVSLFVVNINFKLFKKIRNSRLTKIFVRGWSFIENVV